MRINFNDNSYIELNLSSPGKVAVILGARDATNNLKIVVNCAEISLQDLSNLIAALPVTLPPATIK